MSTTTIDATEFAVHSHNGVITVNNPATGAHRTFRIKTQKPDAKFMPGTRIVSLLTGSDNCNDYTSFGFIGDDGRIIVWRKHQGTQFDRFARMLMNAKDEAARFGLVFQWAAKCRKCNRELTCPKSLASGLGATCEGRE